MIYVVILNWNGWQDTIACLQSLYGTKGADYRVLVCDNGSTDGSCDHIQAWAEGREVAGQPEHPRLSALLNTARIGEFRRVSASALGRVVVYRRKSLSLPRLTLIENGANLGFAAGNNIGIRFALAQTDMTHIWLLNNDTLVEHDCLLQMLKRSERETESCLCGSRIMFYDDPAIIQALGGNRFNRWIGIAGQSIGRFQVENKQRDPVQIETQIDYISGCSMLIPRRFLEQVGLMSEDYFLYYEEIDWVVRSAGSYKLIYADDAVLYHKEGSSIGSASLNTRPSLLSDFYCSRNKLKFTRRHFPWALPSCYFTTVLQILNRWRRGYWASGWLIFQVLLGRQEYRAHD